MINNILVVDSIDQAIKDNGILCYADHVLQEHGAGYFLIDIKEDCNKVLDAAPRDELEGWGPVVCGDCRECVKPIPLKIGWLIIRFIELQERALAIGVGEVFKL